MVLEIDIPWLLIECFLIIFIIYNSWRCEVIIKHNHLRLFRSQISEKAME
jgi:hypothetical protein